MTDKLTSPSFPHGVTLDRTEEDVRAARVARLSMADVINLAARRPQHKNCPWCGSDPGLAKQMFGRWIVGCESDDCGVNPQCGSTNADEAWAIWDGRI